MVAISPLHCQPSLATLKFRHYIYTRLYPASWNLGLHSHTQHLLLSFAGESYAGVYVPMLAQAIVAGNADGQRPQVNIQASVTYVHFAVAHSPPPFPTPFPPCALLASTHVTPSNLCCNVPKCCMFGLLHARLQHKCSMLSR